MTAERITSGLIITVVVVVLSAMAYDIHESIRLFQQCLDDGHKEYQCRAMVRL